MTLITFVFPILRTPTTSLDKCQKGLVSEDASTSNIVNVLKHCYQIHWSLSRQLSWKKSLLLTCRTLGPLLNMLAAHDQYNVLNRHNLTIPIQMQVSQKRKTFSEFFPAFLKSSWNFERLQKKRLSSFVFPKLRTPKTWLDKSLKRSLLDDSSPSNIINVPKHCWNQHHSTFIIFIDHCQVNWVEKSLSYWHEKPWDCLLTHCMPIRSILFLIETI